MNNGYIEIMMPEHPNARSNGTVLEHRLVAEKKIGRLLKRNEVVHHIDEDKTNNIPENLIVFRSNSDHSRFHKIGIMKEMKDGTYICPIPASKIIKCEYCGNYYIKTKTKTNKRFCSLDCYLKSPKQYICGDREKPTKEELENLVRTHSFVSIGKMYGFSDNAVRRWCKNFGIPYKYCDIHPKTQQEKSHRLKVDDYKVKMTNENNVVIHNDIYDAINYVYTELNNNATEKSVRNKILNSAKHGCSYLGYNWKLIQKEAA